MEPGLGSSTWWEEAEYEQLGTANLRALKDARPLEAPRMNVSVRAAVAWFAIGKGLAADWTGVHLVYLASPSDHDRPPALALPRRR